MRVALHRASLRAATYLGKSVHIVPGAGCIVCAVAGTYLIGGLGVALLVAAGLLFAIDRRM